MRSILPHLLIEDDVANDEPFMVHQKVSRKYFSSRPDLGYRKKKEEDIFIYAEESLIF